MKMRPSIAAAGVADALGGTGAVLFPAVASAHSTTHTLRFTAVLLGRRRAARRRQPSPAWLSLRSTPAAP